MEKTPEQSVNNMSMLDAALHYAAQGFKVFPVHGIVNGKCTCKFPGCKPPNSGKHPVPVNGVKAATDNLETIKGWFTGTNFNLAIRTGVESKIWVLDIDGAQGEESLGALVAANSPLPATMESTTGRGRHLLFKHTGEDLKNSQSKIGMKIDSRGENGYIVAPPSRHYSGAVYSLNDSALDYAPDWLEALARGEKKREEKTYEMPQEELRETDWTVADVRDMLESLDPDMDYMEWVRVGMALHEGGFSVVLWDEWSKRGSKYQAGDCVKRWRGFKPGGGVSMGTLVEKAVDAGWTKEKPAADPIAAAYAARLHAAFIKKQQEKDKTHTAESPETGAQPDFEIKPDQPVDIQIKFPDPMQVPGLIGETVRWIVSTSIKPQPELALLHTISCLGAVFGRRYKCQGRYDSRPNVYTIGIAGSGSGKEHSRKQLSVLMTQANLERFMGSGRFVSDSGLLTSLKKQPSQVMPIDEIGLVMQSMSDKKAAGYTKNIATHLLVLYSSSGGVFNAGQYADEEKEPVVLKYPNLCIYGTTTKENYVKALTSDAITDGNLNRFIVIPSGNEFPARNGEDDLETTPPHNLVTQWEALQPPRDVLPSDNDLVVPTPTVVVWSKEIGMRLTNCIDIEDSNARDNVNGLGRLWNRYRDSVQKVAMIFAIARNQVRPEIISSDLDIAEGIVTASIKYISDLCLNSVSDSDHDRDCQKVLAIIKREKLIAYSALYLKVRYLKGKELKDVLDALVEQGKIEIGIDKTKTKPSKIIRIVG